MKQSEIEQSEYERKIKSRVIRYLENQGYQVSVDAQRQGKSGILHTFDMLAESDNDLAPTIMAICIIMGGDKELEASAIFNFANKAYDTGIKDRVLIAVPRVSPEAKRLAGLQRIKVVDEEKIESLIVQAPEQVVKPGKSFRFETKIQLVESLANLGYKVEENAKIKGRSGVEYKYDILAVGNSNKIGHSLGIDIMSGEEEVGLDKVALFDIWKQIIQGAMQDPEIRQNYSIPKLFEFVAELGGAKNIRSFRIQPQGPEAMQQMASSGNGAPIPGVNSPSNLVNATLPQPGNRVTEGLSQ